MRVRTPVLLLLALLARPGASAAQSRAEVWMETASSSAVELTMRLLRDFEVRDLPALQEMTRDLDLVAFSRGAPCETSASEGDHSCTGTLSAPTPELCRGLLVLHLQGQIAGFAATQEFPRGAIRYAVECAGTRLRFELDPGAGTASLRQEPLSGGEPLFERSLTGIGGPARAP